MLITELQLYPCLHNLDTWSLTTSDGLKRSRRLACTFHTLLGTWKSYGALLTHIARTNPMAKIHVSEKDDEQVRHGVTGLGGQQGTGITSKAHNAE